MLYLEVLGRNILIHFNTKTYKESSYYAHDPSNFGNFLWGRAMASMGIYYHEAVIGSHIHNLVYSIVNNHTIEFDSLEALEHFLVQEGIDNDIIHYAYDTYHGWEN